MNEVSFYSKFSDLITLIDEWVWGIPLIALILIGGLWLTIRLNGLQIWALPRALRYMCRNESSGQGEVSSFAALCTALSATIGTGNIVGVATAYVTGGPGALFWMWIAALLGMATKYAEGLLAIKYRDYDKKTGCTLGGPFYYIERGLGVHWKWLASIFALFGILTGLLGIGTFTQINSICSAFKNFMQTWAGSSSVTIFHGTYSSAVVITVIFSFVIAVIVGLVILGGLKRIASVSSKIIPAMVILYLVFALTLLITNFSHIPHAFKLILTGAFNPASVTGGLIGSALISMRLGVARGIFSNEAGLGSAPIAAAAARTNEPARQGLVSMTGTFLDTIIVCSMTGLALTLTGQEFGKTALQGADATMQAFRVGLPFLPPIITDAFLMISLVLFGFTTILGWNYYSERCLEYLTCQRRTPILVFRWLYIIAVFIGPYMTVKVVWDIADIVNGCMAIPNMIALLLLSGVVARETKSYFKRIKSGELKS